METHHEGLVASNKPFTSCFDHNIALFPVAGLRMIQEVLLTHHLHGKDTSGVLVAYKLNATKATLTNDLNQLKVGVFCSLRIDNIG